MKKNRNTVILLFGFFSANLVNQVIFADETFLKIGKESGNDGSYLPYFQGGGTRFFNVKGSSSAAEIDFFVPLWQLPTKLIFTDVRLYDRSGKPFEGNIHLGYRHLLTERQYLYGVYGSFDRKRSILGNYFNQITLGVECWLGELFIGGNFYQPIGSTSKFMGIAWEGAYYKQIHENIGKVEVSQDKKYEKAMSGADIEVGYEITKGLTGYVGGYYFRAKNIDSIYGPKAKLFYDLSLDNGKRILGVFDKSGLEAGVQSDKSRGTIWHSSVNFRLGLLPKKNSNLQGVARHMVDLVRRDVDIVSQKSTEREQTIGKKDGKKIRIIEVDKDTKPISIPETTKDTYDIVIFKGHIQVISDDLIKRLNGKEIIFADNWSIISPTGEVLSVDLKSSSSSLSGKASVSEAVRKKIENAKIEAGVDIVFSAEVLDEAAKYDSSTGFNINGINMYDTVLLQLLEKNSGSGVPISWFVFPPNPQGPGIPNPQGPGIPNPQGPGVPFLQGNNIPNPQGPGVPNLKGPGVPNLKSPGVPIPQGPGVPNPQGPGVPNLKSPGVPIPQGPGVPNLKSPGVPNPQGPGVPIPQFKNPFERSGSNTGVPVPDILGFIGFICNLFK
jgi:hypothetical protein